MSKTTHPAVTIAQTIYDLPDDLNADQQTFLSAVHRITMECARRKGDAMQAHGNGSPAYIAAYEAAERKQADHLAEVLDRYEASVAAQDELEDIELEVAAEAADACLMAVIAIAVAVEMAE